MSLEIYLAYVAACILITIIPGPTVTLIIANSLTHGTRAGLLNVAGTQLGLAIMLGVLLVGLSSIIATMGVWFEWVRIAGAVYLIWLGWKLLRANAGFGEVGRTPKPRGGFFLQGFLVLMSNPNHNSAFGLLISTSRPCRKKPPRGAGVRPISPKPALARSSFQPSHTR